MASVVVPDFAAGVAVDRVADGGMIQGKVGGENVVLVRRTSSTRPVSFRFTRCLLLSGSAPRRKPYHQLVAGA